MDGTLFSSEEIILRIYQEEFQRFRERTGRPERIPELPDIVAQIGKPVREIFAALVPELSVPERTELSEQILLSLVTAIDSGQGHYYPGLQETVRTLSAKGMQLHAASNGRKPYIEAILRAAGIADCFHPVLAVDSESIHNKNELVARILSDHALQPAEALLVGDRASDRDAAAAHNLPFVACLFGHGTAEEHAGAMASIGALTELIGIVDSFSS